MEFVRMDVCKLSWYIASVKWQDLDSTSEIISRLELFDKRVDCKAIPLHLLGLNVVRRNIENDNRRAPQRYVVHNDIILHELDVVSLRLPIDEGEREGCKHRLV